MFYPDELPRHSEEQKRLEAEPVPMNMSRAMQLGNFLEELPAFPQTGALLRCILQEWSQMCNKIKDD